MTRPGLVLVEPLAAERGGHPHQSLPLLTEAARRVGRPVAVVAANGIDPQIHAALAPTGAKVATAPPALGLAWLLLWAGRLLDAGHRRLRRTIPERPLPYQLELFSRCLIEAASLRIGRATLGNGATSVVLTSNITLHALASALSGVAHVRYLHDLSRDESRIVRVAEWATRRSLRRVCVVCTTPAIQAALRRHYRDVRSVVQPYALHDPTPTLADVERERARERLGILEPGVPVGSLIGGWWQVKDMATVAEALPRVSQPFTLLVAGYRMDPGLLGRLADGHSGRVHVIERQLSSTELQDVYAASDFTIVSRMPGGKESGVALDAASRGVPLVISDHDDDLNRKLAGQPWARVFRCGDPDSLADALDDAAGEPLFRPGGEVAALLGMLEPEAMLEMFDCAAEGRRLLESPRP